jgi:hypothetical protein
MPETDPLIPYANPAVDQQPADPLLRRVVGGAAIVYSGIGLVSTALHVALARKWAASPPNVSWELGGAWTRAVMAAEALSTALVLAGGAMMLRGSRMGILLLRCGAAASVVLSLLGIAMAIGGGGTSYRSMWITPAAAALQALELFRRMWPLLLMMVLTLPPLSRRP